MDQAPQDRYTWDDYCLDAARAGIKPAEFYAMTPRELALVLEGERWRVQQRGREAIGDAWQLAQYMRSKKLPDLKGVLKRYDRACEKGIRGPQTPDQVWAGLKSLAAIHGMRVTRHPRSVLNG